MSHVATVPHELTAELLFTERDAAPYWALRRVFQAIDGGASSIPIEVSGRQWDISLSYQSTGLEPREKDDVEEIYGYRVHAYGPDREKLSLLFQPRLDWSGDRRPQSVPKSLGLGVSCRVQASNLEPIAITQLIPEVVSAAFDELGASWSDRYFTGEIHEYSAITAYERYLRLQREQAQKVIRSDGVFRKILELLGDQEGMKFVYSLDNREIVGYNHQLRLDSDAIAQLFDGSRRGKQFKHYHPEHVRSEEHTDDPLYHPKFGALFKKNLNNDNAVPWSQHRELTQELEEEIVNLLEWSDVSTKPGPQFIADDHFSAGASERDVAIYDDPTPEIEAEQESVLIRTMRQLNDSDQDVLEAVAMTDGGKDVAEIEAETDWSTSTVYRVLKKLGGLLECDNGNVQFIGSKLAEKVREILSVTDDVVKSHVRAIENVLDVDPRDLERKGRAWANWCDRYAAEVVDDGSDDRAPGDRAKIRIRCVLSEFKSKNTDYAPEILEYGQIAWSDAGRDPSTFGNALVEFDTPAGKKVRPVSKLLR